jgi:hypothetical protein
LVPQASFVHLYVTQEDFEDYAEKAGGFVRFADLLKDSKPEFSKG